MKDDSHGAPNNYGIPRREPLSDWINITDKTTEAGSFWRLTKSILCYERRPCRDWILLGLWKAQKGIQTLFFHNNEANNLFPAATYILVKLLTDNGALSNKAIATAIPERSQNEWPAEFQIHLFVTDRLLSVVSFPMQGCPSCKLLVCQVLFWGDTKPLGTTEPSTQFYMVRLGRTLTFLWNYYETADESRKILILHLPFISCYVLCLYAIGLHLEPDNWCIS